MLENHLEKLRAFHATAELGSFLSAAQSLKITQPAITKSIRQLEDQMQVTLFHRHRRGVELTRAGTQLQQFCQTLFLKIRDLEKSLRSDQKLSGVIRVGTYETLGELIWPEALRLIAKECPDLTVELKTENPESIWRHLEVGALELVVDAEPKMAEHLYSKVLYTDHFGLFSKKGSPFLKSSDKVPLSYVRRAHDRNQVSVGEHLRKVSSSFEFLYDVESFTLVRSFILADVCVGVLPYRMAEAYLKRGEIVSYPAGERLREFGEHRICVTCLESSRSEERYRALFNLLKAAAGSA